jgi:hypothetical protein
MNQNSGAMNSQSMIKSGDQPRVTQRDMGEAKAPPSMSYVRYQPRGASTRNNSSRSGSRG